MEEEEEEEEEEVFITSGNWRGKHNSLSRGAARLLGASGHDVGCLEVGTTASLEAL